MITTFLMMFITNLRVSAQEGPFSSVTPLRFRLPQLAWMIGKWSLPQLINQQKKEAKASFFIDLFT
jgi:hypothetical protein